MERDYDPEPSIRRFLAGTPPILGLAAVEEGVRLTAEAGVAALHAKAIALTELMSRCTTPGSRRSASALAHAARPGRARLARRARATRRRGRSPAR